MKLRSIVAALVLMFVIISCEKNKEDESLHSLALYECKTIGTGSNAINICTDILHDSRCPDDVVCATAGMAYAKFTAIVSGNSYTFFMTPKAFPGSPTNSPSDTTIAGFKIEFLDIIPHRRTDNVIIPVQKARLRITRP